MRIFSKQLSETELLQKKSDNIINVFTKTVDELNNVNENIKSLRDEKTALILSLQTENETLNNIEQKNKNIVSKILKILE